MSSFRGHRGPNLSAYINELNTIPSPLDQEPLQDDHGIDDSLTLFTNAAFEDYDMPSLPEAGSFNFDFDDGAAPANVSDFKYEEILNGTDTTPWYEQSRIDVSSTDPVFPTYNAAIRPAPVSRNFAPQGQVPSSSASPVSAHLLAPPSQGQKRKAESSQTSHLSPDEQSRVAAEEDKRRRNTAASARFRVKKKQREQNLEKTVKEINDENAALKAKLKNVEQENAWLKGLFTEMTSKDKASKEPFNVNVALQKLRKESEERQIPEVKDPKRGVGTAA